MCVSEKINRKKPKARWKEGREGRKYIRLCLCLRVCVVKCIPRNDRSGKYISKRWIKQGSVDSRLNLPGTILFEVEIASFEAFSRLVVFAFSVCHLLLVHLNPKEEVRCSHCIIPDHLQRRSFDPVSMLPCHIYLPTYPDPQAKSPSRVSTHHLLSIYLPTCLSTYPDPQAKSPSRVSTQHLLSIYLSTYLPIQILKQRVQVGYQPNIFRVARAISTCHGISGR
jgi:hypothetical protein